MKIEIDLERARAVRNRPGGQPARGDVERDVPGMIEPGRARQPDLADNLRPQLQRRGGVRPGGVRQFGPAVGRCCHDAIMQRAARCGNRASPLLPPPRRCRMILPVGHTCPQGGLHAVHHVIELHRSGHPRHQGRPQAGGGGARSRQESRRRTSTGISYLTSGDSRSRRHRPKRRTATTRPSSRWRSVRSAMCARAPPAPGRPRNTRRSSPTCPKAAAASPSGCMRRPPRAGADQRRIDACAAFWHSQRPFVAIEFPKMPKKNNRRPFRVARSRTGLGLFATRPIRKGLRIAEYKGRKLPTKEADKTRGARQSLPVRNQQPLDHRRHAAQQYRTLLQSFLQSQRGNIRRQAPGVHPHAARHQAGRGNHLRLRHRLSQERDRALELQMRPLHAAARPQGARTARAVQAAAGAAAGQARRSK